MKKFCVIGNPINHSLSPQLHNYWIKENNIEAIYTKKKLEHSELKNFISEIRNKKIDGANVTVPFKKNVIPYLDQLSQEAQKTNSVNTIYSKNDILIGDNTDVFGFEQSLNVINYDVSGKRILILGAGGVVPSIIFALYRMNVSKIVITNRTKEKAEIIKNFFNDLEIIDWGQACDFDMVINATSLGLNYKDKINLDYLNTIKNKFFYDVIYNPSETQFLKNGKILGNKTENGKMMFIFQAYEAFNIWHKFKPKIDKKTIGIVKND